MNDPDPDTGSDKRGPRPPCRRCMMLRFFALGVMVIAVIRLIAPDALGAFAGLSTMSFALIIVGGLAVMAIAKSVLDWIEWRQGE